MTPAYTDQVISSFLSSVHILRLVSGVMARLHALFPSTPTHEDPPPLPPKSMDTRKARPAPKSINVRILTWNMHESLPKVCKLHVLLRVYMLRSYSRANSMSCWARFYPPTLPTLNRKAILFQNSHRTKLIHITWWLCESFSNPMLSSAPTFTFQRRTGMSNYFW